jgi:hypothetical protein
MDDSRPEFYLAAMDVYRLDRPLKCWRIKVLHRDVKKRPLPLPYRGEVRDEYLLVKVEPPFVSSREEIDRVLLSAKDPTISWSAITEWPLFVFVLCPQVGELEQRDTIDQDEFVVLDWAALFPTEEAASEWL